MPDYDKEEFKTAKVAYLKLLFRIKKSRHYSIEKVGPTYLLKDEETERVLRKYLGDLYNADIALEFNEMSLASLRASGVDFREESLERGYLETTKEGKEYFILFCNSSDFIDDHIRDLYIPDSLGFRLEDNGRVGKRMLAGGEKRTCNFTREQGRLLQFLYENANEPQKTEIIMRDCELTERQISSACNAIRSKMQSRTGLRYTPQECLEILPRYKRGIYVLNIYPEES